MLEKKQNHLKYIWKTINYIKIESIQINLLEVNNWSEFKEYVNELNK
jgi:hypothetical protein